MSFSQTFNPLFPRMAKPYSFYHMGIKPESFPWSLNETQKNLDAYLTSLNGDWIRYAPQNYVVWTNLEPLELANGIRAAQGLRNLVMLITPFQADWANGYMPPEFWQWLKKIRFPQQQAPNIPGF